MPLTPMAEQIGYEKPSRKFSSCHRGSSNPERRGRERHLRPEPSGFRE
jgi:hypothetical protein